MRRKNWTLIEVMIVVAIIAILGAIAFPSLSKKRQVAMERTKEANIKLVESAVGCYLAANPNSARSDVANLDTLKDYLPESNDTAEEFQVGGEIIVVSDGDVFYADKNAL